jgi:hypothetical protein
MTDQPDRPPVPDPFATKLLELIKTTGGYTDTDARDLVEAAAIGHWPTARYTPTIIREAADLLAGVRCLLRAHGISERVLDHMANDPRSLAFAMLQHVSAQQMLLARSLELTETDLDHLLDVALQAARDELGDALTVFEPFTYIPQIPRGYLVLEAIEGRTPKWGRPGTGLVLALGKGHDMADAPWQWTLFADEDPSTLRVAVVLGHAPGEAVAREVGAIAAQVLTGQTLLPAR